MQVLTIIQLKFILLLSKCIFHNPHLISKICLILLLKQVNSKIWTLEINRIEEVVQMNIRLSLKINIKGIQSQLMQNIT